mmetsp:Transcript_21437/g.42892  ORF Transcript_21437/g.42892 Transcript_21437/m.42892 type:complete len:226 (-) Transcript_21437:164-841(-)
MLGHQIRLQGRSVACSTPLMECLTSNRLIPTRQLLLPSSGRSVRILSGIVRFLCIGQRHPHHGLVHDSKILLRHGRPQILDHVGIHLQGREGVPAIAPLYHGNHRRRSSVGQELRHLGNVGDGIVDVDLGGGFAELVSFGFFGTFLGLRGSTDHDAIGDGGAIGFFLVVVVVGFRVRVRVGIRIRVRVRLGGRFVFVFRLDGFVHGLVEGGKRRYGVFQCHIHGD